MPIVVYVDVGIVVVALYCAAVSLYIAVSSSLNIDVMRERVSLCLAAVSVYIAAGSLYVAVMLAMIACRWWCRWEQTLWHIVGKLAVIIISMNVNGWNKRLDEGWAVKGAFNKTCCLCLLCRLSIVGYLEMAAIDDVLQ